MKRSDARKINLPLSAYIHFRLKNHTRQMKSKSCIIMSTIFLTSTASTRYNISYPQNSTTQTHLTLSRIVFSRQRSPFSEEGAQGMMLSMPSPSQRISKFDNYERNSPFTEILLELASEDSSDQFFGGKISCAASSSQAKLLYFQILPLPRRIHCTKLLCS